MQHNIQGLSEPWHPHPWGKAEVVVGVQQAEQMPETFGQKPSCPP